MFSLVYFGGVFLIESKIVLVSPYHRTAEVGSTMRVGVKIFAHKIWNNRNKPHLNFLKVVRPCPRAQITSRNRLSTSDIGRIKSNNVSCLCSEAVRVCNASVACRIERTVCTRQAPIAGDVPCIETYVDRITCAFLQWTRPFELGNALNDCVLSKSGCCLPKISTSAKTRHFAAVQAACAACSLNEASICSGDRVEFKAVIENANFKGCKSLRLT